MSDRLSIQNAKYIITANQIFHSAWATYEMAKTYRDMIAEQTVTVEWNIYKISIHTDYEQREEIN